MRNIVLGTCQGGQDRFFKGGWAAKQSLCNAKDTPERVSRLRRQAEARAAAAKFEPDPPRQQ